MVLLDVMERARDSNILVVTSAGNDGLNNDFLKSIDDPQITLQHYPSDINLKNIISTAALGISDNLLWIESDTVGSNYGVFNVDVAANGERILSAHPGGSALLSGTSMAAGQITRIAAIKSYQSGLQGKDLKNAILNFANSGANTTIPLVNDGKIMTNAGITTAIQ